MPSVNIEIEDGGLLEFDPKLEAVERDLLNNIKATNEEIAHRAVDILTTYPPETPGNFPPAPYWVRGEGMVNAAGETIRESYKYGESKDRWQYQTSVGMREVVTRASTTIPYAPYVGSADLQAWFHERNGWLTDEEVVDFIQPEAQERMNEALLTYVDLLESTG